MTIFLPLLLLAAAQAGAPPPPPASAPRLGRGFISPMGEPVFGRQPGEDGLVAWFAGADANHDGVLTADEMAADAQRFFVTLDVDGDGEIGPDEITRYETEIAPRVRVRAAMESGSFGTGTAETVAGRYGLLQIPEPVITADSNFNRGVSLDEFRTAAVSRFQLLDNRHVGRLSLPQLQTIRQAAIGASRRRPVQPSVDSTAGAGIGDSPSPSTDQ